MFEKIKKKLAGGKTEKEEFLAKGVTPAKAQLGKKMVGLEATETV